MTKLIRTNFVSPKEAELAKDYLTDSGLTDLSLHGTELDIRTNEENWIAAFEILTSLGGSLKNDTEFSSELEEFYRIKEGEPEDVDATSAGIDLIDDEAYIDQNLGYGDYELLEPYILERYHQRSEDREEKP